MLINMHEISMKLLLKMNLITQGPHGFSPAVLRCCALGLGQENVGRREAVFSFLYLKKLKFQKYMSVLENFKNIPRSPYGGDRAQM